MQTGSKSVSQLISGCLSGDRKSQKQLYDIYSAKMFPICLRFFPARAEAEDVLQDGFIKLFTKLHSYRSDGVFDGWVRRIFINTAIEHTRRKKQMQLIGIDDLTHSIPCAYASPLQKLFAKDVIDLAETLSNGYRTVFHLYSVQGYTHREIGEIIGSSENTSRSQYKRAKDRMRLKLTT